MSAHTPGPWTLETVKTSCGICHKVGPFPPMLGDTKSRAACIYVDYPSDRGGPDEELLNNAHLIAAAPDLLEALEDFLSSSRALCLDHSLGKEMQNARAAIAKAKGETQ